MNRSTLIHENQWTHPKSRPCRRSYDPRMLYASRNIKNDTWNVSKHFKTVQLSDHDRWTPYESDFVNSTRPPQDPSSSGRLEDRVTWNSSPWVFWCLISGQTYHVAERILQFSWCNSRHLAAVGQIPIFLVISSHLHRQPTFQSLHILNKSPNVGNPRIKLFYRSTQPQCNYK